MTIENIFAISKIVFKEVPVGSSSRETKKISKTLLFGGNNKTVNYCTKNMIIGFKQN